MGLLRKRVGSKLQPNDKSGSSQTSAAPSVLKMRVPKANADHPASRLRSQGKCPARRP